MSFCTLVLQSKKDSAMGIHQRNVGLAVTLKEYFFCIQRHLSIRNLDQVECWESASVALRFLKSPGIAGDETSSWKGTWHNRKRILGKKILNLRNTTRKCKETVMPIQKRMGRLTEKNRLLGRIWMILISLLSPSTSSSLWSLAQGGLYDKRFDWYKGYLTITAGLFSSGRGRVCLRTKLQFNGMRSTGEVTLQRQCRGAKASHHSARLKQSERVKRKSYILAWHGLRHGRFPSNSL